VRSTLSSLRLVQPFAAYSLTQQSFVFSGFAFNWLQPVALLMFAGGFIAYNFYQAGFFLRWVAAGTFVIMLFLTDAGSGFILLVFALMFLTWLYMQPAIKTGSFVLSIRKIPFLKTFLLAIIWTLATAVIPLACYIPVSELFIEGAARFLFLMPVVVASDQIDYEKDKAAGVLSLPVMTGLKISKRIITVCLLFCILFTVFIYLPVCNILHASIAETLMLVSLVVTGSLCLANLKNKTFHRILLDLSVSSLFLMMVFA
jgi:hypothetical protein